MDPFAALTDTVFHQSMEIKHVQTVQSMHADRLLRIEKKQADDAALKSVWTSPFPSVLTGTPNQGAQTPYTPHSHTSMTPASGPVPGNADVFEDFDDEHCQSLLTSLHLDEDPIPRRGASRANSVRFDVSAIQGSGWGSSHASRPSNDFGPVRPNSAFGLSEVNRSHSMERSMSHKSEGRHSSAGHSVHSGRTSSLGLMNHFSIGGHGDSDEDEYVVPAPPPGLFVLGTVPTIIRCWLNENFSHSSLLYAVVCTGSQRSTITQNLVRELGLQDQVQREGMGLASPAGRGEFVKLPVYLPEAVVTQSSSRPCSPDPQLPTLTVTFDVLPDSPSAGKKGIRVFLGADTLRAHSADLLLSQNKMALNGDDGNRLSVPFVRPEDESVFKSIVTGHVQREKVSLNGTAAPFTPAAEKRTASTPRSQSYENEPATPGTSSRGRSPTKSVDEVGTESTSTAPSAEAKTLTDPVVGAMRLVIDTKSAASTLHTNGTTLSSQPPSTSTKSKSLSSKSPTSAHHSSDSRDPTSAGGGIWTSWRSSATPTPSTEEASSSTSGYKAPLSSSNRSIRSTGSGIPGMKVLKPSTSRSVSGVLGNSKVGTGASYEPPTPSSMSSFDDIASGRRKSGPESVKWEDLRKDKDDKEGGDHKGGVLGTGAPAGEKKKMRLISGGKTANPIGTASAFSWMKPGGRPTTSGQ